MNQVKQIIEVLNDATLTQEERTELWNAVLGKLGAVPLESAIVVSPDGIVVNGKSLDGEQASYLRQASIALNDNFARKVINEQLKFLAITTGIHNSRSVDELMFSKACLWVIKEEEKVINSLCLGEGSI